MDKVDDAETWDDEVLYHPFVDAYYTTGLILLLCGPLAAWIA